SSDMTIHDVDEASSLIREEAHEDAQIIFGAVIDDTMGDELRVTVIATGVGREKEMKASKDGIAPAFIIDDMDVPTIIRKDKEKKLELRNNELHRLNKFGGFNMDDEDMYDTPTFLRKQAD
ncbi:MAG: cell division protein FtsZ, partial [Deltaproteobacteria bacterium]|nr:cell division protein FtsZ [Deltaproteobacteria bacterium]